MKRISRNQITNVFNPKDRPVADVSSGDRIIFETLDALGGRVKTHADALAVRLPQNQLNPATGPVYVHNSQPDDTLCVTILDIKLGNSGFCRTLSGNGVIIDELNPPAANLIPVREGTVHFNENIRFKSRPMVGVIGVAPQNKAIATFYPGSHGGNLDINACGVGSTIYLPVAVEGALLSIGDIHARMGDGELNGGGIDIDAEVTVEIQTYKHLGWKNPVVETPDSWCTCYNAPSLPEAIRGATSEMATLLATCLGMSREEAFILIGAAVDTRIGQAAELGMDATAYLKVSKEILPRAF